MKDIKEIKIEGETIYLKKSKIFGWNVIYPNKINGKINWKNFIAGGSWIRLVYIILIILIILGCINEYTSTLRIANECLNNCNFKIRI